MYDYCFGQSVVLGFSISDFHLKVERETKHPNPVGLLDDPNMGLFETASLYTKLELW
jgi:hypothetical protein